MLAVRNQAKFLSSVLKMSTFVKEEGYEKRVMKFQQLDKVEENVYSTSHLSTSRQGSSKAAFGGLIFAQALAAAEDTVDSRLKPNAIHSFFIANVDTTLPVEYRVRRIRDGRSFTNRTVDAVQNGVTAFIMQASFHVEEEGSYFHQDPMPVVPHWSQLHNIPDLMTSMLEKSDKGEIKMPKPIERRLHTYDKQAYLEGDLFEIRPTDPSWYYLTKEPTKDRTYHLWVRTRGDITVEDDRLHRFLIAYNTDSAMAGSIFRPHLWNEIDTSMVFSLDHNIWIHHPNTRADQWLLFESRSSIAHSGRGFSQGRLWTEDGKLVLSCTQEAVIRSRDGVSRL